MTEPMCSKCGLPIAPAEFEQIGDYNRKSLKLICANCWKKMDIMTDNEYLRLDLFIFIVAFIIVVLVLTI